MASKNKQVKEDPEVAIESAINKTEIWIMRNGKTLLTILVVIIAIASCIAGYVYLYKTPQQKKASAAIFQAQNYFAVDSFPQALNGDGNNFGFLQVIDKYGSTNSGNIAKHYAGQCYLRMGDYDNALKYFGMYKNVKGIPSELVNAMNAGMQGDAYAQKGDVNKAINMYEKAVATSDNGVTAPYYTKKAAMLYEGQGKTAKAIELYKEVKQKYPGSFESRDIDKYIAQAEQKL